MLYLVYVLQRGTCGTACATGVIAQEVDHQQLYSLYTCTISRKNEKTEKRRAFLPSLPTNSIKQQVIETVALVAPRRGVSAEVVKHALLVGKAKEVVVLAITYRESFSSGGNRRIEVSVCVCVCREREREKDSSCRRSKLKKGKREESEGCWSGVLL